MPQPSRSSVSGLPRVERDHRFATVRDTRPPLWLTLAAGLSLRMRQGQTAKISIRTTGPSDATQTRCRGLRSGSLGMGA